MVNYLFRMLFLTAGCALAPWGCTNVGLFTRRQRSNGHSCYEHHHLGEPAESPLGTEHPGASDRGGSVQTPVQLRWPWGFQDSRFPLFATEPTGCSLTTTLPPPLRAGLWAGHLPPRTGTTAPASRDQEQPWPRGERRGPVPRPVEPLDLGLPTIRYSNHRL